MSPLGARRAELPPPSTRCNTDRPSVVSSAGTQSGWRTHCFRAETPPAPGTPNMTTSDPQTPLTQVHGETLCQPRDPPPGGAVRASGQPGCSLFPVPPLHPARATPPIRSFAANPIVTATGSSPWRPQTPRPSHLCSQSSSDRPPNPPQAAPGVPPFVTTPPRFQRPALRPLAPSSGGSLGYAVLAPSSGRFSPILPAPRPAPFLSTRVKP